MFLYVPICQHCNDTYDGCNNHIHRNYNGNINDTIDGTGTVSNVDILAVLTAMESLTY